MLARVWTFFASVALAWILVTSAFNLATAGYGFYAFGRVASLTALISALSSFAVLALIQSRRLDFYGVGFGLVMFLAANGWQPARSVFEAIPYEAYFVLGFLLSAPLIAVKSDKPEKVLSLKFAAIIFAASLVAFTLAKTLMTQLFWFNLHIRNADPYSAQFAISYGLLILAALFIVSSLLSRRKAEGALLER